MTTEQLQIFRKAFFQANDGRCSFPKKINYTENNRIEFYTNGMRGGLSVNFKFYLNEFQEYYIELFGYDDFSSWHKIIDNKGNIKIIETKI